MSDDQIHGRLTRIEDKIDKLTDALATLARIETHQQQQHTTIGRLWEAIEKIDQRIVMIDGRVKAAETLLAVSDVRLGINTNRWRIVAGIIGMVIGGVATFVLTRGLGA